MVRVVCEGKTDKNKLKEILDFLGIGYTDTNFTDMGDKSKVLDNKNYKALVQSIRAGQIDKVLFVIDADYEQNDSVYGGYKNSKIAVENTIAALQIQEFSDFYICCDPSTKDGYFESLLLSTVDESLKKCYEDFLSCIGSIEKNTHKNIMEQLHKITKPQKPYDFNHKNFEELTGKLKALFL